METPFFNSPLFETIICLILVYALLSLLVSTILEAINSYFKERGTLLFKTISQLFDDNLNVNFGQLMYTHPMVDSLKKDVTSLPQYISPQMFSNVLIDVVGNYARKYSYNEGSRQIESNPVQNDIFERYKEGIQKMQHTDLKLMLLNMVEKSEFGYTSIDRLNALNQQIQQWFNDQMDRTSGWYKKSMRWRLFYVGLFVTIALNVDSIHLFQSLYHSPDLRTQLVPIAENLADNYTKQKSDTTITELQKAYRAEALTKIRNDSARTDSSVMKNAEKLITQLRALDSITNSHDSIRTLAFERATSEINQLSSLGLPIGWHADDAPVSWFSKDSTNKLATPAGYKKSYFEMHKVCTTWNVVIYILGILITATSLSFGAPFWFDLLLKAINIRRAGAKPSSDKN